MQIVGSRRKKKNRKGGFTVRESQGQRVVELWLAAACNALNHTGSVVTILTKAL